MLSGRIFSSLFLETDSQEVGALPSLTIMFSLHRRMLVGQSIQAVILTGSGSGQSA